MHFIETPTFRRVSDALLSLDEFRVLQLALYDNPEAGDVISGTAGLRKVRVARAGHGKRGGARGLLLFARAGTHGLVAVPACEERGRPDQRS